MNLWKSEHVAINEVHASSLFALINSTTNLMWSVDRDYNLIVSNDAFDRLMVRMRGAAIEPGQCILADGFTAEENNRYKAFYDRVIAGGSFTITDHVAVPSETWSEVSFFPICNNGETVGVACYSHDITQRRVAENELRVAHDRLLLHAENTPMGFVEWDKEGQLLKWSAQAERIFGWSEAEMATRKEENQCMIYPEDLIEAHSINEQLFSGERGKATMQNKVTTKDGRTVWCQWFSSAIKNKEGQVTSILSQILDITEQKMAEAHILHANRLYSFISQVNQLIVQAGDETTLFSEVCGIAVATGGFSVAWVGEIDESDRTVSLSASCGLAAEDIPMFMNVKYEYAGLSGKALKHGTHAICTCIDNDPALMRWQPLAQQRGWKSAISFPIVVSGKAIATFNLISPEIDFFSEGEVALLGEATGDISFALGVFAKERRRQEVEYRLTLSEQRLRQAQSIAHIGSWHLDYATGISTWSDEACRIHGLPESANVQSYRSWLSFIHPDDILTATQIISESIRNHDSFDFHYRIVRPDGEIRYAYTKAEYELDEEGLPVSLYGVVQDVTGQKKAEAERTQMVADIVQRVKDLEQFSYIVSHNLRAPVANIRGLAEILQMPGIEKNEAGTLIAELGGCVRKLDDVIHDLNYILQIRDKEDMHNETVRFSHLLNDITDNMATQLRNEGAVISADFSEVEEMQTVRSFMHSIFLNIISNSVKYHRPGLRPHISISTHRNESMLQIRFKDNGLGIDLEKRGHQVFGLYKRFHGHVQGKGMGLFMVKTQVESLGGQIYIESKVDKGTEFTLEFELTN